MRTLGWPSLRVLYGLVLVVYLDGPDYVFCIHYFEEFI